jgi:tetratricopeptide (TPR) repeat protein
VGELQKAISLATKAVEFAQRANNPEYEVHGSLYLAMAFAFVGQPQKDREWTQKALATLDRMNRGEFRDLTEARLYLSLGRNYLRQRETQPAIEYLARSVALYDARINFLKSPANSPRTNLQSDVQYAQMMTVYCLASLGRAYLQAGNSPEAIKVFERGLAIESASGFSSQAEASMFEGLGRAYLAQKDSPRAIEYLTRALRTAEAQQQSEIVAQASTVIGQFFMRTGKWADAAPYFKKAIDSIESRRSVLESEDTRTSFFENTVGTYANMIRAQLANKNLGDAFNYSERARSRTFLDVLGSKSGSARAAP